MAHIKGWLRMTLRAARVVVATLALGLGFCGAWPAHAQDYQVLVYFTGQPVGDAMTISFGKDAGRKVVFGVAPGGNTNCPYATSCGIVFELDESGNQTVLYSFTGPPDDTDVPSGPLIQDSKGNLYGTTYEGGSGPCTIGSPPTVVGCGTVFRLIPPKVKGGSWTETVLHSFQGEDGKYPLGSLVLDGTRRVLYGTTPEGGAFAWGTVFELNTTGETVLYSFTGQSDGGQPETGLVLDPEGTLYGTTYGGGITNCGGLGCGTVFELNPVTGAETVLHAFTGLPGEPEAPGGAPLIRDAAGNLYGTTPYNSTSNGGLGYGTVFEVSPQGKETVLYTFQGFLDGAYPLTGLVQDTAGNLYGTNYNFGEYLYGTIFEVTKAGKFVVLNQNDTLGGTNPSSTLLVDAGHLYGTMETGGDYQYGCLDGFGCGTLFELTP
jgi:uncharacterized repeat protein (TIGR03803 family)